MCSAPERKNRLGRHAFGMLRATGRDPNSHTDLPRVRGGAERRRDRNFPGVTITGFHNAWQPSI